MPVAKETDQSREFTSAAGRNSYLDVLGSAGLDAFLLQLVQHRLQRALHGRLWRLGLAVFLLQLRAEAFGQSVAALPRQRSQIFL